MTTAESYRGIIQIQALAQRSIISSHLCDSIVVPSWQSTVGGVRLVLEDARRGMSARHNAAQPPTNSRRTTRTKTIMSVIQTSLSLLSGHEWHCMQL
jgi:hypothetical protein